MSGVQTVLMVAEKPSICTSVAEALYKSNKHAGRPDSRNRSPPVYEFDGRFRGQPARFRITSVTGHLFSLDFPPQYQNWDTVDPADLFTAPTLKSPEGKGGIVKHLEREARGADALVLWMDCDREGENICFEVIHSVEKVLRRANPPRSNIYRARFSAVTQKDIEKAMASLVAPNENEAKAVDARQELDLKVGVAFSRFQTRFFQGKYGDLDSSIISYGPCQTPTLGFCVARHDEIQHFTPQKYFTVKATLAVTLPGSKTAAKLTLNHEGGRIFKQHEAERLQQLISQSGSVLCTSVAHKERRRVRPLPLNTVGLLKLCSQLLGIGPHSAMRAAEHLYLSGYLSYPRTESTAYPSSHDTATHRDTLQYLLRRHPHYGEHAQQLLTQPGLMVAPRPGVDKGDHPPISPVGDYLPEGLSYDEQRVYDLVCAHYLATITKNAVYRQTKAHFFCELPESGKIERFNLAVQVLTEPGFMALYKGYTSRKSSSSDDHDAGNNFLNEYEDDGTAGGGTNSEYYDDDYAAENTLDENQLQVALSLFAAQQRYPITSVNLTTGRTTPPGYLTEAALIDLMEKNGIGTDASIPVHINNILTRNYVTLGNHRTLIPTKLGIVLVHGYHRIDPAMVLPQVRASIEKHCTEIALGRATPQVVIQNALTHFSKQFLHFRDHIGYMDSLFEASFSPLAKTGKALGRCGKCLRYMRYIPLNPQRLYCPTCEETYPLPQGGTIKLYKELKCPLDNFDLVLFSLGNGSSAREQGKSFPICPYCYSHPPAQYQIRPKLMKQTVSASGVEAAAVAPPPPPPVAESSGGGRGGGKGGRGRGRGGRDGGRGGREGEKEERGGRGRGRGGRGQETAPPVPPPAPAIAPALPTPAEDGGRGQGKGRGRGRGGEGKAETAAAPVPAQEPTLCAGSVARAVPPTAAAAAAVLNAARAAAADAAGRGSGGGRGRGKGRGRGGGDVDSTTATTATVTPAPATAPPPAPAPAPQDAGGRGGRRGGRGDRGRGGRGGRGGESAITETAVEQVAASLSTLDIEDIGPAAAAVVKTKPKKEPREVVKDQFGVERLVTSASTTAGGMGCNTCVHPTCRHSLHFNGVCACPQNAEGSAPCPGTMVLDVNSRPHWKLACNVCNTILRFQQSEPPIIHNITVVLPATASATAASTTAVGATATAAAAEEEGDEDEGDSDDDDFSLGGGCVTCGDRLLAIELHKDYRGPLYTAAVSKGGSNAATGSVTYTSCLLCDDLLSSLVENLAGRSISLTVLRQMRERRKQAALRMGKKIGRGRGRGRGKRMTKDQVLMSFSDF